MGQQMISKWFSEYGKRSFIGFGEYFEGNAPDIPLTKLLNLSDEEIRTFTKDLFDSNELSKDADIQALLTELSRGINALFQFQDILSVSVDTDLINQHYPYYESLVYLRESVVSWLDRNVLASLTLLRPFLELSVLHLYWYLICKESDNKQYYDWLKRDKGKPTFQDALNYVFKNMPAKGLVSEQRLQELEQSIRNIYKGLCAYNHTPKMNESIAARSGGFGNISLESFLYYLHVTTLLLRQVIYLFILIYPMSLFPVERHKKWGFGGPVGLFFDKTDYMRLEAYIGLQNITTLKQDLNSIPEVQSLIEWFDSLPTLTSEQINADWKQLEQANPAFKKSNAKSLPERLALEKSLRRSRGWALNYVVDHIQDVEITEEILERLKRRVKDW
jgi:hypothetical protein